MIIDPRVRKIGLILLLLASATAIALLFYFLFLRRPPSLIDRPTPTPPTDTPGLTPAQPGEPGSGGEDGGEGTPGGLTPSPIADGGPVLTVQLTSSPVVAPTVVNGNQVVFYDPSDGRFYTIDTAGNVALASDNMFPQAQYVAFDNTGNKVAVEFPDGTNVVYDLRSQKQTTLPAHWNEFNFSPGGDQLISKSLSGAGNALVVTNSDGTQARNISALGNNANRVHLNWSPNNSIVAFADTGAAQNAFGRKEIYLIDPSGTAVSTLIVDGTNFSAKWAPNGNAILYSVADVARNERPALWFTTINNNQIGTRRNLQIETWVEKCVFKDDTNVICAVPREVKDFSGSDHRFITSGDDVYQINLTTGRSTLLGSPVAELRMENLHLSDDQSLLYFTDQIGRLNSMRLR